MSKYETGEITLDVETLYNISKALHVNVNQLMDYQQEPEISELLEPVQVPTSCPARSNVLSH